MINKIIVNIFLASGHSQKDGEVEISWHPINFSLYSDLFPVMVKDSVDDYLSNNKLEFDADYEIIMSHMMEFSQDGFSVTAEWFEPIYVDSTYRV